MEVLFSVLSYRPSIITDESINVGILFHDIENDIRLFESTTNWARLKSFDDELDIDYFKMILHGIKEEVSKSIINYRKQFDIGIYTKAFVNELKFSDIAFRNVDVFKDFVEDTKKIYLRYDFAKRERPNHQQQLIYIRDLLKDNRINYSNKVLQGFHKESIKYDYIIDEFAFKLFTFEDKNLNKLVNAAKSWAYTASEMKEKYKSIFVYDQDLEGEDFKIIINILSKNAFKVMKMDEAMDFLLKLRKDDDKKAN